MTMPMDRIPDLLIEKLAGGELDEVDRHRLEREYGAVAVQRRLEALRRSDRDILDRYPPGEMANRIHARMAAGGSQDTAIQRRGARSRTGIASPRNRARLALRLGAPLGAFIVVLAVGVVLFTNLHPSSGGGEGIRAKGVQSQLFVYEKTPGGAELLQSGDVVKSGDRLQMAYVVYGNRYGVILSIDGRGVVTVQYPESSAVSAHLKSGGEYALPFGYELDNAPFFERFFLVVSGRPFRVARVKKAAVELAGSGTAPTAPLRLPAGIAQHSFLLRKAGD